jgi:hypothetical protein
LVKAAEYKRVVAAVGKSCVNDNPGEGIVIEPLAPSLYS